MKRIKFKYKESWAENKWKYQECIMRSVDECIEWYGLGQDCEYEILSVEDIEI